jgi:hypothetical protein
MTAAASDLSVAVGKTAKSAARKTRTVARWPIPGYSRWGLYVQAIFIISALVWFAYKPHWALSSKIQAASAAASSGQNQAAGNILNAFLNQLSAQAGKHVTGVAPQILLEDAESLISQVQ